MLDRAEIIYYAGFDVRRCPHGLDKSLDNVKPGWLVLYKREERNKWSESMRSRVSRVTALAAGEKSYVVCWYGP